MTTTATQCDVMKPFPGGCGGCGGACCKNIPCAHLTGDGRCRYQVEGGYGAKPKACRDAVVGCDDCVAYREQFGTDE